jgi:hypothetical protein
MLIQLVILITIGYILYKLADYYFRRYLGFNSSDHTPVYTPGSSDAPALVCVLGWGGCTRRQLRRLLDFYSSNGIPTVSWINPMLNYTFASVYIKQVERVLDLLLHENRNSNKIIIHLHSNNGTLVFSDMVQIMRTNERYSQLLSNIKGVIFDSAPYIRLNSSSDWLIGSAIGSTPACVSVILNRAQYFHFIWSPLIIYYLFLRFFYQRYFSSDPSSPLDKILRLLSSTPTEISQYYLYSEGDRLVPHHVIGKFFFESLKTSIIFVIL